jgi:hypothetical protein
MWLSFRGYLWWMQTNAARPKTYRIAWLIFAVSFGLPAMTLKGCDGKGTPSTMYGWQAGLMTCSFGLEALSDTATFLRNPAERSVRDAVQLLKELLATIAWNLPNLMMLASPFLLYWQQHGKGRVLSLLFSCAAFSSWTWGIVAGPDLRIGYFVWSAGITAVALARRPGWRTLAVLVGLGLGWLVLSLVQ